MFTLKRILGSFRLPKLFGTELQLSTEVKYLGVILDNRLNWSSHLDKKIDRASVTFWQCRRMIGKRWGLSPKIVLWLYRMVIRPMLCYGALVWWPRSRLATVANKLQKFQRLACLAITGCMRTAPTKALEAMLGLPPLHLYIQQEAAASAIRLRALRLWRHSATAHTGILAEAFTDCPLLEAINDRIPKQFIFDKRYKIQLYEDNSYEGLNPRDLRIFTDGSKTKQGTGSGVFSEDLNIRIIKPLGRHNTVFQAECFAIILAATAILSKEVKEHSIRILSDSMAVLQALKSNIFSSGLIHECHTILTEVCKHNHLTLQWIKGHSGSRGNDGADELARRGSGQTAVGPEPIIPIPAGKVRSLLRDRTATLHTNYWNECSDCRQAREALPAINRRLSGALLRLNKPQLRTVTSAITGHGTFNRHLFNLGVTDSPLCRGCMEAEETTAHVLLECQGVSSYRAKNLGSPGSIPEVLKNVGGLLKFFEEIGWLE